MSGNGEDERGEAKPVTPGEPPGPTARNPFLDDEDPLPVRKRRAKPPPGIITAGGVDMARAHASGIKLRDNTAPEPTTNQPRVVVAVETDPRKVPTHKRLLEGRDPAADGSRSAMLPGGSIHTTPPSGGKAPSSPPRAQASATLPAAASGTAPTRKLPAWAPVAFVLILLLFVVGIAQRFRPSAAVSPPPPRAEPAAIAPAPRPPVIPAREPPPVLTASAAPTASTAAPAPTTATQAPRAQPVKPPPAATPRATFTPPFQLPGEKN